MNFETVDRTVEVLRDISLSVEKGKVIVIAGKTRPGKHSPAQTLMNPPYIPPSGIVKGEIAFYGKGIFLLPLEEGNFRGKASPCPCKNH